MTDVKISQGQKLALDLGPLLAFFVANWQLGLLWATAVLMAATFVSLAISYYLTRKINKFALVGAVFVGLFGAITLYLQDPWYLKLKVTLIEGFFAFILLAGLYFKRIFLKDMMGSAIEMPDDAWRTLTIRWAVFFAAMGIVNIVIWNFFSTEVWVAFKAFGLLICTLVFALANAPFMAKYIKD
ncbi:inner membrane-spanning protein YciB [Aestuariivirga litoralis]|uniref:inner membrane-spanning protein YciB n=1 Tax=Aestuariivirga litoralis TaxID=2650924 RepID=UPI0018C551D9|nr:inner membrane-spanning protein YciB [Aestuariivirga litoralis]MBG1233661.1 septation protein IspZ [Aestuariivirga litoralis]